jgi:hypothetical protein
VLAAAERWHREVVDEGGGRVGHEEVPSRHPLAALAFAAILSFVGGRVGRGTRTGGRAATPPARQAPVVADQTGIFSLLAAEGVSQVGNMMTIVAGPWFVLETTASAARTGIVSGPLVIFGTLAMTPPLGILVPAGFLGLLFGPINPPAVPVIQEHTPPQMLGRVFGALTAWAQAGIPVGAVLAGLAVQQRR